MVVLPHAVAEDFDLDVDLELDPELDHFFTAYLEW